MFRCCRAGQHARQLMPTKARGPRLRRPASTAASADESSAASADESSAASESTTDTVGRKVVTKTITKTTTTTITTTLTGASEEAEADTPQPTRPSRPSSPPAKYREISKAKADVAPSSPDRPSASQPRQIKRDMPDGVPFSPEYRSASQPPEFRSIMTDAAPSSVPYAHSTKRRPAIPSSPTPARAGSSSDEDTPARKLVRFSEAGSKVIFSGIQPTGIPTLGNYLGALREWKRLEDSAEPDTQLFFSIVDLHALTMPQNREHLRAYRRQALASLLAIGLNPERSNIFFQSAVSYHSELQWILSCTASTGYLSRMTQWKSKMQLNDDASLDDPRARKSLKHGLFSYPILQAADILLYRTTHVPVGEDQRQHIEFARECVTNFNHSYSTNYLVAPQAQISPAKRIMSLTNPTQKMSKSEPSYKSRILITDSDEDIKKKIRQAVTDSDELVTYDPAARPGVSNLIEILASFDPQSRNAAQLGSQMKGHKVAELKQVVSQVLCDELAEIRERYHQVINDKDKLNEAVSQGAYVARERARQTMHEVWRICGLDRKLY